MENDDSDQELNDETILVKLMSKLNFASVTSNFVGKITKAVKVSFYYFKSLFTHIRQSVHLFFFF